MYIRFIYINLAQYVTDRIDILELLIDKLIYRDCLDTIEFSNDLVGQNIKHYLIKKITKLIVKYSKTNINLSNRYVNVLKKIYSVLKLAVIAVIAIMYNAIEVIKMLMVMNFNFDSYD